MTLMSPTVLGLVRVTRLLCGRDQRDVGRAHNVVMDRSVPSTPVVLHHSGKWSLLLKLHRL